jgi:hypothetical protein
MTVVGDELSGGGPPFMLGLVSMAFVVRVNATVAEVVILYAKIRAEGGYKLGHTHTN